MSAARIAKATLLAALLAGSVTRAALAAPDQPAAAAPAPSTAAPPAPAGESAPPMPHGDPEAAVKKDGAVGEAKAGGTPAGALEKLIKAIKADGPLKLQGPALAELAALMPGSRRGEECAEGATVKPEATGLKDRGDGALLVAQVTTCKGGVVMAFSPGLPTRVSRLLDLGDGEGLSSAHALNLSAKRREEDLGLELSVQPHRVELHLLLRREGAFAFTALGNIKEFGEVGDCSAGGDVAAGYAGFLKVDAKSRLLVLRVDASCGTGPWAARCDLWTATRASVEHAGVCALPPKLDARSLRAAGWK